MLRMSSVTTRLRGFPVKLTYDPNSEIGRYLFFRGSFEEQILKKIKQTVKSGDIVLDVGANIGVHTLVFSTLVGNSGQVVAIEPQSKVRKRLVVNLENNQIGNVHVLGCAIGAEDNVIELVTFIQRYHIITVHKHTRKTPHETSAKTNG